MAMLSDINTAINTLYESFNLGVNDPDSIWVIYCRATTQNTSAPEIDLPRSVPELKRYTPDISIYDALIGIGGWLS
jgi:hypothetical protein